MDVVYNLIHVKKFSEYTSEEQIKIKQQGCPLPDISIEREGSSRGKPYKRQFNREIYARNNWICGCNQKNALYCFPCVLFGGNKSWTKVGVTDLVHLGDKIKRHEHSKRHLHNQMEFALLGTANIKVRLDSAYWQKHDNRVTENHHVLSKIINSIKFSAAFDMALHRVNENGSSDKSDDGLINATDELNKALAEHLQQSPLFKGTPNEILDCMLEVCQETILAEIQESPYVAIMVDEVTDALSKSWFLVILRYCINGDPVERFWTYLLPAECQAEDILGLLERVLGNSKHKLIAQSYDGAPIMSEQPTKVQKKHPFAHFIHSYTHQLNQIMSKALSEKPQVQRFFENLGQVPIFFERSPQYLALLDKIVPRNGRWDFTVDVVFEHRESLVQCMEDIEDYFDNQVACNAASSIRRILKDPNFVFWLTFFHHVMPQVEDLFSELQQRCTQLKEIDEKVAAFEQHMTSLKESVEDIADEALALRTPEPLPAKKERKNNEANQLITAKEVCDIIVRCARERYASKGHLLAASLFYSEQFDDYNRVFPEDNLNSTCWAYPNLNKKGLKTELSVIYLRPDCRNVHGVIHLLKFLIENDFAEAFQETKKLLEILITTPMCTTETERCLFTLTRAKVFLRNTLIEDRQVALSMLSIEKKLMCAIPDFNVRVIDKFAALKDRKMDLIYKNKVTRHTNAHRSRIRATPSPCALPLDDSGMQEEDSCPIKEENVWDLDITQNGLPDSTETDSDFSSDSPEYMLIKQELCIKEEID